MKYSKGTSETITKRVKQQAKETGYYRIVTAGTVHVYGVVGYDVATASYYTYTYNVLDDERHSYLDYSKDNPNFTDCENGIVTFEVPIEVNEYILGVTGQTKGLGILQGTVNSFDVPKDFDGTVVIPQYHSTNNGGDGSDSAYKVTSFSEDVFKNKTEITRVILPTYVTEIPDNAVEGCTNLETVIAYGVTKIGANAFKGCTSLKSFSLDNKITELGENANEGVEELKVMAANASVADAAINSGAKNITINISKMVDSLDKEGNIVNSYNNDKEIVITEGCESFTLISDGLSYNNLQIESHATETFISNMKFVNNKVTPLKLHSPKVTLARVAVENSQGFALMLLADNTELNLYAAVPLSSVSKKTVLSKNVTFAEASAGVSGSALNVTGNYYIYGSVTNDKMLKISEGELVYINEDEFANMQSTATINFNANGGNVAVEDASKIVTYNQTYGTLPVPTRQYFTFLGWYTEAEGGTEITENSTVNVLGEQTLYAQWAQNVYSVVFDANGGTVTETLRTISCGEAIGELPVPQRTGYNFDGWYTEDNTQITADTISGTETTIQAIAKWTAKAYKISWNTGTGYKITVNRTSSPYANAATGALASGDTIFEGDVLSIAYSATTGYSLGNKGKTSVTVTGNVTASDIYANATANNYTYNILYRSTNGTDLGSATATYKYNTTNTISAPAKSGYNTPAAQTVAWNSTSAKTITFYYEPTYLYFAQGMADGNWYVWDGKYGITYSAYTEFQNRTANSIQIRIVWTNTMKKNSWYGYAQYFTGNIGGISTGEVQIASSSLWNSGTSSDRTATVTSNWITVPVSATQRTVSISASYRDLNGIKGSWSNTVNIPTY